MQVLVNPEDPRDTVRLGDRTVPRRVTCEIWLDGDGPGYRLALEVIGDRPQCREIRIISRPDGPEVRQRDLEWVCVAELVEQMFGWLAAREDGPRNAPLPGLARLVNKATDFQESVSAVRRARAGRSPRKVTPAFLQEVAGVYRRNIDSAPTAAVAAAFGITHSTAAEYVRRARASGFLPPTTPGKRKG